MTLSEALTGGAFDRLNWQHSREFDQNFSKKSNAPGFARGGMGGFGIDRYINLEFNKPNKLNVIEITSFSKFNFSQSQNNCCFPMRMFQSVSGHSSEQSAAYFSLTGAPNGSFR